MHRLNTRWDAFYIFAPAEGKGFVIVAADDRVRPVLAYSFHNNAMRNTMAPSMNWWLDGWQQQVDELRNDKGGERNEEWQQLLDGDGIPRSLTALAPMITTQWDQDAPYNDSCPTRIEYGSEVRALTGCVATAMAQVMKYWNYPEHGTGTHTYNSVSLFGYGYTYYTFCYGNKDFFCTKEWKGDEGGNFSRLIRGINAKHKDFQVKKILAGFALH